VIPTTATGSLSILVQFSAGLVAYGTKGTIEAVAAHEFTHYLDLVRKLSSGEVSSDERESTLYGSAFADPGRTLPPKLVFSEKSLVSLVSRKFKDSLVDPALNKKVGDEWIAKNLPIRWVSPDENVVRIPMSAVASAHFDPVLLQKVSQIKEKMKS
jgi:hypothetical protein